MSKKEEPPKKPKRPRNPKRIGSPKRGTLNGNSSRHTPPYRI